MKTLIPTSTWLPVGVHAIGLEIGTHRSQMPVSLPYPSPPQNLPRPECMAFYFLASPGMDCPKSYHILLPSTRNSALTAEWPLENVNYGGKGANIFKVVSLSYLYHIYLDRTEYFGMKNKDRKYAYFIPYWFPSCRLLSVSQNSLIQYGRLSVPVGKIN